MFLNKFLFSLLFGAVAIGASAWSQKGHDVTACIAERHLTETTRAAVDSILEGRSMVYWANWLDNASHQLEMAYTKTWHYKNIDTDIAYEDAPLNSKGDVVTAVNAQIAILSSPATTPAQASLAMKILVHCLGDMHQPMHLGHLSDLGGNKTKVKFFDRDTNLHAIWDSSLPDAAHKWSYSEWQEQIDRATPEQEAVIVAGTPDDWARETFGIATRCYKYFRPGQKVMYNDIARWSPVIEEQFLRGGLRLAHLLNSIFDPAYAPESGSATSATEPEP